MRIAYHTPPQATRDDGNWIWGACMIGLFVALMLYLFLSVRWLDQ